jgi:uncharacterized DUF497 family protein
MSFIWDNANISHLARHNISPEEAEQVIQNEPLDLDFQVVNGEIRNPQIGETDAGRILVVISTQRGDDERVVTAWDATSTEKAMYLQYRTHRTGIHP